MATVDEHNTRIQATWTAEQCVELCEKYTQKILADVVDLIGEDPHTVAGNLKSKRALIKMIVANRFH